MTPALKIQTHQSRTDSPDQVMNVCYKLLQSHVTFLVTSVSESVAYWSGLCIIMHLRLSA